MPKLNKLSEVLNALRFMGNLSDHIEDELRRCETRHLDTREEKEKLEALYKDVIDLQDTLVDLYFRLQRKREGTLTAKELRELYDL